MILLGDFGYVVFLGDDGWVWLYVVVGVVGGCGIV